MLEWAIRKNGIQEVLVRSVMSKQRVDSELSEEFEAKVGCTKDACCHFFFLQL